MKAPFGEEFLACGYVWGRRNRAIHSRRLPIFLFLEDRKHVGEGPTLGSVLRPPVVVPLHTAHPHHGIDAGAATKYVAKSHIEFAIVQSRRGDDGQVVVKRSGDIVEPDARVRDGRRVVGSS